MLKRVLLINTRIHQWHKKLRWNTTNPGHHNVIKRYLIKYFVKQSCTQRSCAFWSKGQNGQNKKSFLFSTAISPEKRTKKSGNDIAVLLLTKLDIFCKPFWNYVNHVSIKTELHHFKELFTLMQSRTKTFNLQTIFKTYSTTVLIELEPVTGHVDKMFDCNSIFFFFFFFCTVCRRNSQLFSLQQRNLLWMLIPN